MVPPIVPSEHLPDPNPESQLNVEPDRLHLVVTPTVLHQFGQGAGRE